MVLTDWSVVEWHIKFPLSLLVSSVFAALKHMCHLQFVTPRDILNDLNCHMVLFWDTAKQYNDLSLLVKWVTSSSNCRS